MKKEIAYNKVKIAITGVNCCLGAELMAHAMSASSGNPSAETKQRKDIGIFSSRAISLAY